MKQEIALIPGFSFAVVLGSLFATSCTTHSDLEMTEVVFSSGQSLTEKFDRRFSEKPVSASFGNFGQIDFSGSRLRSLSQSYGAMTSKTELRLPSDRQPVSLCGPSTRTNEMVCLDQETGELLDRMPIPGDLSAAPLFHNGSWILATTKGFLIRTAGLSDNGTPVLGMESFAFWGAESRPRMSFLRNEYRNDQSNQTQGKEKEAQPESKNLVSGIQFLQVGWNWYHWSSAEFISHLVVQGSRIIGMTSNQYVYAIEFESGKIDWATRIATNEDLKIASRALSVSSRYVIVGNSDGQVSFLNPVTGKVDWQYEFSKDPNTRFAGIVSQPLVAGGRVLVSNASSQTALINEKTQKVEWSVPFGSVAAAKRIGENFYLGTSDGKIVKLDGQSGRILAEKKLAKAEPVASIAVAQDNRSLLVALRGGSIIQLDAGTFDTVKTFPSQGVIKGEFVGAENSGGYCASTAEGVARCFASAQSNIAVR